MPPYLSVNISMGSNVPFYFLPLVYQSQERDKSQNFDSRLWSELKLPTSTVLKFDTKEPKLF